MTTRQRHGTPQLPSTIQRPHASRETLAHLRTVAALLALLALLGCGGGGGGGGGPAPTNLGVLASTVPTTTPITFTNPLGASAQVTETATSGGFSIDPADLPVTVPAGAAFQLGLVFAPTGAGTTVGSVTLRYDDGVGPAEITYAFQATAESVIWSLITPSLDYGLVAAGSTSDLVAQFRNTSTLSPVTLTGVSFPGSQFSVVGSPFPLTVQPGQVGALTIRYAPLASGTHDGNADIGPSDLGGPVTIPLIAASPGGGQEDVTDFGQVAFFGGLTASLNVTVPADAISLTLECADSPGESFGLGELIGPGGKVYENTSSSGAYIWIPGSEVFSTTVPNTDRTDVQLVPGGGTYSFRIRRFSGSGTAAIRAIVERRPGGIATSGTLPLNVFLANGITPTAATADTDSRLQNILARIEQILGLQGMALGDVDYYDVTDPTYDEVTEAEFPSMLQLTSAAAEARLNLFFVQEAIGGGVVGVSATLAGPKRNGTTVSGVMSVYSGFTTNTVGLIAAHEIGHFLGLYHTVEQNGNHDFIDDTVECPPTGTSPPECPTAGGGLLMHWQAVGGISITDGQALVILGHPLMEPGSGGSTKPAFLNLKPAHPLPGELEFWELPEGWCGTCRADK